jgi:uncharacterized protein (DUF1684 family)
MRRRREAMSLPEWQQSLERARETKDAFFTESWQSPIPFQDRPRFKGLQYYPPASNYRFELELHEYPEQRVVRIAYTRGNEQDFLRWGEFTFNIAGKDLSLEVYKSSREEEMLFVPFKDATSGNESYGAGRYLDLEPDRDRTPEGKWILDFNQAYNPWCAYSEAYTCPFVPEENWLEVPIYAGEKDYHLPKEDQ